MSQTPTQTQNALVRLIAELRPLAYDPPALVAHALDTLTRVMGADESERDHVRRFHEEMLHMYRKIAPPPPASPAAKAAAWLRPSHLATLRLLLDGLGEKEIARRLDLSQHTVHDYVGALYLHFGVASRSELLAKFIPPDALPD